MNIYLQRAILFIPLFVVFSVGAWFGGFVGAAVASIVFIIGLPFLWRR